MKTGWKCSAVSDKCITLLITMGRWGKRKKSTTGIRKFNLGRSQFRKRGTIVWH
jgi:hypothetical protein